MGTLRFLLALSVAIEHIHGLDGHFLVGGKLAVQIFYAISGFYMYLVLNTKYLNNYGGVKSFYKSRFFRIFPVYWIVLGITVMVSGASYVMRDHWGAIQPYAEHGALLDGWTMSAFIAANILVVGQDALLFFGMSGEMDLVAFDSACDYQAFPFDFMLVPQMWSVSLELMFYAMAPFVLKESRIRVMAGLFLLSLLAKIASMLFGFGNLQPWNYRFFPFEICIFLGGAISCRAYLSRRLILGRRVLVVLVPAAITLILSIHPIIRHFVLADVACLIVVILCLPSLFTLTKKSRFDCRVGELSYPIYLVHLLIIWIFQFGCGTGPCITMLVGIPVTVLAAQLIKVLFERPIDIYRQKFSR